MVDRSVLEAHWHCSALRPNDVTQMRWVPAFSSCLSVRPDPAEMQPGGAAARTKLHGRVLPHLRAHDIAPGALATAKSMPSAVRTCCTQRGQGSCTADPSFQLGSVARYLEKTAVVPLASE